MERILVVDDVIDNVKLLSYDLSDLGYEVLAAYDGRQAQVEARAERPDVILLDIILPDVSGVEVCRQLKADPELRHIPIIMISGKTMDADVIRGLDAGAMDYVTKPFSRDIVAARVRSAVRIKAAFDTINEMNRRLDEARCAAEAADRVKSTFLATMTHELRAPLNSVIGFTTILLDGLSGPLNEQQAFQLGLVNNSASHLLNLINDLLDIAKIEAGEFSINRTRFNLLDAIDTVTKTMSPLAAKKSLRLATRIAPTECWMMTDRRRVEQVLFNLISNAIKFSETGEIRIECEVDGDAVLTRVVDQGIGIKPEDMHNLFVPYKQIDSSLARRHQGTGLGLSISMKLVQAMGGHLHAHSEWGVGSTFGFTLPLVPDLRG